jgi:hypothetical protein
MSRPAPPILDKVTLDDELLLHLLLDFAVFGTDLNTARATYEAARPANSSEPTLDDVIGDRWSRII